MRTRATGEQGNNGNMGNGVTRVTGEEWKRGEQRELGE